MDEELTAGLRGFTNVWQRVTGTAAEAETKRPASKRRGLRLLYGMRTALCLFTVRCGRLSPALPGAAPSVTKG